MRNGKTQQQKCLEYIKRYEYCTISDLIACGGGNYPHKHITTLIKTGILSPEFKKCISLTGKLFYTWYPNDINWNKVDMQKCVLNA